MLTASAPASAPATTGSALRSTASATPAGATLRVRLALLIAATYVLLTMARELRDLGELSGGVSKPRRFHARPTEADSVLRASDLMAQLGVNDILPGLSDDGVMMLRRSDTALAPPWALVGTRHKRGAGLLFFSLGAKGSSQLRDGLRRAALSAQSFRDDNPGLDIAVVSGNASVPAVFDIHVRADANVPFVAQQPWLGRLYYLAHTKASNSGATLGPPCPLQRAPRAAPDTCWRGRAGPARGHARSSAARCRPCVRQPCGGGPRWIYLLDGRRTRRLRSRGRSTPMR